MIVECYPEVEPPYVVVADSDTHEQILEMLDNADSEQDVLVVEFDTRRAEIIQMSDDERIFTIYLYDRDESFDVELKLPTGETQLLWTLRRKWRGWEWKPRANPED